MEEWRRRGAHFVVLPMPVQGHINPMQNFSKRLASKGMKVTLAMPLSITNSVDVKDRRVTVEPYSDGYDDGGIGQAGTIDAYMQRFKQVGMKNITKLIEAHRNSEYPVKCLIFSSFIPFGMDIAKELGIFGASFFTQSCAVNAIYYHAHQGHLTVPVQEPTVSIFGLPLLKTQELPSFLTDIDSNKCVLHLLLNQFSNAEDADWFLFNTFDKLEEEVIHWMMKKWPGKMISIGPTLPSTYFITGLQGDYDNPPERLLISDLNPAIKWLNTKAKGSVVYVSFGSVAKVRQDQIEEIAWGLKICNKYCLWVVRDEEEHKLPNKFKEEMLEKGLVVSWCPQLEVLAHEAVGCFVTHCGWNSTIEALSFGVAMIAVPLWVDQPTVAKFLEDVWGVGVRVKVAKNGIAEREEIVKCMHDVMQGKTGEDIKKNIGKWKQLAKEAMEEGGSSDTNIERFIARVASNS